MLAATALSDGNESVTTFVNTPVSGSLLANALPPNGTTASVASFLPPGSTTPVAAGSAPVTIKDPSTGAVTGTLAVQPNGTFTFTPAPGYTGPVPTVDYTVQSSDGQRDTSTLDVSINPPLTDGNEQAVTRPGAPVTVSLLDNAVPPTGTTDTVTSFTLPGSSTVYTPGPTPVPVVDPATGAPTGTIVVLPDGTATFTPASGFSGPVPTISYMVASSDGQKDPSALDNTVVPRKPIPAARLRPLASVWGGVA